MSIQIYSRVLKSANDEFKTRHRTVPIPETIRPIQGYPSTLVIFKIKASKYWQVRCWMSGKLHRKTTNTQSLGRALSYARSFYELLILQKSQKGSGTSKQTVVYHDTEQTTHNVLTGTKKGVQQLSFGAMSAQMLMAEQSRVDRGEFSRASWMVLKNRLDAHLLPRWSKVPIKSITHRDLANFVDFMSPSNSTITISQYLVVIRKVFKQALIEGAIDQIPEFPKIKIKTASRGAFTPTEYWQILRKARSLRGIEHPNTNYLLSSSYKKIFGSYCMPPDLAWAISFMVNAFIRPSDLKTLKHRHVEMVKGKGTYLRLTLPETKSHSAPIVTLFPAVRTYREIIKHQSQRGKSGPNDYLFLPDLKDRNLALRTLSLMLNWVLDLTGHKLNANGNPRSMYSLRHSAITFRLLYGQGIDLLTLARNARTSVEMINNHYASTISPEQNIAMLQSRRSLQVLTS